MSWQRGGRPREAIATGKTVTKQVAGEFRAADRLLRNGLDELILQFKVTSPAFFSDYQNARAIVDTAATRESKAEADKKAA